MRDGDDTPPAQAFVAYAARTLRGLPDEGACLMVTPEVQLALSELEIELPQPELATFPQACRKFCSTARMAGLFVTGQVWIHSQQTRTIWNSEEDYKSWLSRCYEAKLTGVSGAKAHVDKHTIQPDRYK